MVILLIPAPGMVTLANEVSVELSAEAEETPMDPASVEAENMPGTITDTGTAVGTTESYLVGNITDIATDVPTETEPLTSSSTEETEPPVDTMELPQETLPIASSTPTTTEGVPAGITAIDTSSTSVASTQIEIENTASASTSASTTADSGENNASGPDISAIITGDAYAYANVVNLTNTNLINSEGFIVFLNQLFGSSDIDVRDLFNVFSDDNTTNPCTNQNCEARQLDYHADNQSVIENSLTVSAKTGDNHASGTSAIVNSGDAYAAANITNIANTNIIDANYMILTFSNFGDLLGDVVLPGKHLLEKLFQTIDTDAPPANMSINNQAAIENNVSVAAATGDNNASGTILTGNATTYSNVFNQVNTSAINSDSFTMLFRVSGDWSGQIYGLPENLTWEQSGNTIAITNALNIGNTAVSTSAISADITNSAHITNTVSVSASTGNNSTTASEQGYIETGNAYAAANITNIANTNILGRNWSLLIFDIFGDWQGDISFGQPDLWIGGTANTKNGTTGAGQELTYTFTISNLGDATATNVLLSGELDSDVITIDQPLQDVSLGSIAPGETVEKTFTARVTDSLARGSFPVNLTIGLTATETEQNLDNNTEIVTVIAENIRRSSGRSGVTSYDFRPAANLAVTKTSNRQTITPGESVSYEVTIVNHGGPVYGAILYDTLFNQNGEAIENKEWNLQTIDPEETIIISYDTKYATSSPAGPYLTRAQVLGYHKNQKPAHMKPYDSMIATVPLLIEGLEPAILGLSTTASSSCDAYLTSFIARDTQAPTDQIHRLQRFINDFTPYTIPINEAFDTNTENAVREFQREHASEILEPWGLSEPTGNVYLTTKKKINDMYCAGTQTFPLAASELSEINRYRTTLELPKLTVATPTKQPEEDIWTSEIMPAAIVPNTEIKTSAQSNKTSPRKEVTTTAPQPRETLFGQLTRWITNHGVPNFKFLDYLVAGEE